MAEKNAISLFELNRMVREVLANGFPTRIWIIAEISELNENRSGHCYLELVDKDPGSEEIRAVSRAAIWASQYRMIKPYFETVTGQVLQAGIKVMVSVRVDFHERYGFSLNIVDIEPSFTIGELARKRIEILQKLEKTGVITMNRDLELKLVPQKIAVISSDTAAGYGDFINQLKNNPGGYQFYTKLFQSVMQGTETGTSIIKALDRVAVYESLFDAVVIIRGGGAKTDLTSFDDYDLGYYITQFPLPVIVGIGHERDQTVLDIVAHTSCKTPTSVAEFLINQAGMFYSSLDSLRLSIIESARKKLENWKEILLRRGQSMQYAGDKRLTREKTALRETSTRCRHSVSEFLNGEKNSLGMFEKEAVMQDPARILKRGYSITYYKGMILKSTSNIQPGNDITTRLHRGALISKVTETQEKNLQKF